MNEPAPELKSLSLTEWALLLSHLPPEWRELATEYKLLETKYGEDRAKFRTPDQLMRALLLCIGAGLPRRQTVALLKEAEIVDVSPPVLHQKMRLAGPYLQKLVNNMAKTAESQEPEVWFGYDVLAIDATADSSPGSDGTDARVHTAIRVSDFTVLHAEVTSVSGGETLRRFRLKKDQLGLVDRGYANGPGIASAIRDGGAVLGRLNRGSLPLYEPRGPAIDVINHLRSLKGRRVGEWAAEIRTELDGNTVVIPIRFIAVRLPKEQAAQARERVRKEYAKDATPEMYEVAGYVALYTTARADRITAYQCIELYRLRWQVELLFKRWKSICGLDELPNFIEDTVLTWILGKILLALVLERMAQGPAIPTPGNKKPEEPENKELPPTQSQHRPKRPLARAPWMVTSLLWPSIIAALLPLRLQDILRLLPRLARRLAELTGRVIRQVEAFRQNFCPDAAEVAGTVGGR
jgi:hypothetical protein